MIYTAYAGDRLICIKSRHPYITRGKVYVVEESQYYRLFVYLDTTIRTWSIVERFGKYLIKESELDEKEVFLFRLSGKLPERYNVKI